MGSVCSRRAVINAIPDRDVMISIVDRIVEFEEMLKTGTEMTRVEEREKKQLDAAAAALKKVHLKSKGRFRKD